MHVVRTPDGREVGFRQSAAPVFVLALAFAVPAVFSTLTGTSWGSAGTIGVVLMGVGVSVGADLAIVAGAVIGGALFGDKLSPLSDTTNFAVIKRLFNTTPAQRISA